MTEITKEKKMESDMLEKAKALDGEEVALGKEQEELQVSESTTHESCSS